MCFNKMRKTISIITLSLLGLCFLCGLVKIVMKKDSIKKNCDKVYAMAMFAAVALVGVNQILIKTHSDNFSKQVLQGENPNNSDPNPGPYRGDFYCSLSTNIKTQGGIGDRCRLNGFHDENCGGGPWRVCQKNDPDTHYPKECTTNSDCTNTKVKLGSCIDTQKCLSCADACNAMNISSDSGYCMLFDKFKTDPQSAFNSGGCTSNENDFKEHPVPGGYQKCSTNVLPTDPVCSGPIHGFICPKKDQTWSFKEQKCV